MKKIAVVFFLFMLSQPICASDQGDLARISDGPRRDIEVFFSQLLRGKDEVAVTDLFSQSPISREGNALEKTTSQLKLIRNVYGKIEKVEHIDIVFNGKSLFRLRTLVYYHEFPIRFTFIYYKSPLEEKWLLGYFSFDDQIQRLFNDDLDF